MLVLGNKDLPGFLVEDFVVPVGVEVSEGGGQTVVFSQHDDLQNCQLGVLVTSDVTWTSNQLVRHKLPHPTSFEEHWE